MFNVTPYHALSGITPSASQLCKIIAVFIKISCLFAICSLSLHAAVIAPGKKKRPSSGQKSKTAHHNGGKHVQTDADRQWPGQGNPKVERVRNCIRNRESRGNYKIADKGGRWFGAYQFDINTSNTAAKRMRRPDLVGVPANKWTSREQDVAFYVIYDEGDGKSHFYHPGNNCF
jgi:hypothetical protein